MTPIAAAVEGVELVRANEPAFPVSDPKAPPSDFPWVCGMTLREHYAGLAMARMAEQFCESAFNTSEFVTEPPAHLEARLAARSALAHSDALIAALEGTPGHQNSASAPSRITPQRLPWPCVSSGWRRR